MSGSVLTSGDIQQVLQSVDLISPLIKNLGEPSFPVLLWEFIDDFVNIEESCVYLLRRDGHSVRLANRWESEERDYWHHFMEKELVKLLNPYFNRFISEGFADGFYHITDVAPDDFKNSEYYKVFFRPAYDDSESADEGVYVTNIDDNNALFLTIERGVKTPALSGKDLARCKTLSPLITALCFQQWAKPVLQMASEGGRRVTLFDELSRAFEQFGSHVLTDRERDVAALMLKGHSSKSAARALDIAPDTERAHRKRLYTKLNISSQAELFTLFFKSTEYLGESQDRDPLEDYIRSRPSR